MRLALSILTFLAVTVAARASELSYPREIALWQDVAIPLETDRGARAAWSYAANYSRNEWQVLADDKQVYAQRVSAKHPAPRKRPAFTPQTDQFRGATAFSAVDDGWLVAFNHGEFGAALYWFSNDGKQNYKISGHQVVEFFVLPDGVHAIEGLAHMGMSAGSIIRIARPEPHAHWKAAIVTALPSAPYAIAVGRDHTMFVTLSRALVSVGEDKKMTLLLADPPWGGLYPNSSVLAPDERKLYIGMRQFVAEFDIQTKQLRLLIPSAVFLNKLPQEEDRQIRKQYGD